MLNIRVPAGIGDISWTYMKVCNLNEKINWYISDDIPQRSLDYVNLLPLTNSAQYQHFNFHCVADHSLPHTTTKEKLLELCRQSIQNVSPNRWLESGKRIEGFMPELYTDFHYDIPIPILDVDYVQNLFMTAKNPIGIFCASYQGNAVWSGWPMQNWVKLINELNIILKDPTFVFLGASWDKPYSDDLIKQLHNVKVIDLVDKTHISKTIEVIKNLKYFISFPSGLPVLANVLRTPAMMFYPHHLHALMNTWPDPESKKDGSYKGCSFPTPQQAIDYIYKDYQLHKKIEEDHK